MRLPPLSRELVDFSASYGYPPGILSGGFLAPAIAIPLEDKTEFECPREHLAEMKALLPRTDRLLITGWRATEKHFLRVLSECLKASVKGFVCCGNPKEGAETEKRLGDAGIKGSYQIASAGFTDMITRRELDSFLPIH
jgi:hypothetical protein